MFSGRSVNLSVRLVVSHFAKKLKQIKSQENQNSSKFLPKTQANGSKTQVFGKFVIWE